MEMIRKEGVVDKLDLRQKNYAMEIDGANYWKFGPPVDPKGEAIVVGTHVVFDYRKKTLEKGGNINSVESMVEIIDPDTFKQTKVTETKPFEPVETKTETKPAKEEHTDMLDGFLGEAELFLETLHMGEYKNLTGMGDVALMKLYSNWQVYKSKNGR